MWTKERIMYCYKYVIVSKDILVEVDFSFYQSKPLSKLYKLLKKASHTISLKIIFYMIFINIKIKDKI